MSVADLNARFAELQARFAVRSAADGNALSPEELPFSRALRGEVVVEEVIARRADTDRDVVLRTSSAPVRAGGRVVRQKREPVHPRHTKVRDKRIEQPAAGARRGTSRPSLRKSAIASVRNIPAAALTAYARSEDRIRTLSSGFQMHLSKPIDSSELVAAVAALAHLKVSG